VVFIGFIPLVLSSFAPAQGASRLLQYARQPPVVPQSSETVFPGVEEPKHNYVPVGDLVAEQMTANAKLSHFMRLILT